VRKRFVKNDVKDIAARPLTKQESGWVREILETSEEWRDADIGNTRVIAEGPCDQGISLLLQAPAPEKPGQPREAGYIGRLVICTADDSMIEVRLNQSDGRLRELFVLFVDPKHPNRALPATWVEVSHEAIAI
jgi:hypothetical protein